MNQNTFAATHILLSGSRILKSKIISNTMNDPIDLGDGIYSIQIDKMEIDTTGIFHLSVNQKTIKEIEFGSKNYIKFLKTHEGKSFNKTPFFKIAGKYFN